MKRAERRRRREGLMNDDDDDDFGVLRHSGKIPLK